MKKPKSVIKSIGQSYGMKPSKMMKTVLAKKQRPKRKP